MPPPPPPSKSYSIVIDSDSSDEEDGYRIRYREETVVEDPRPVLFHPTTTTTTNENSTKTPSSTTAEKVIPETGEPLSRRRPHAIEEYDDNEDEDNEPDDDDDDGDDTSTEFDDDDYDDVDKKNTSKYLPPYQGNLVSSSTAMEGSPVTERKKKGSNSNNSNKKKLTKNQKKKLARRRKKKKVKSCSSTSSEGNGTKRIQFSNVSIRIYPRTFSQVAVPGDGGWPLGMELKPLPESIDDKSLSEIPLDDFEVDKQIRLKERWDKLLETNTLDEIITTQMTKRADKTVPFTFETRQWDYCVKIKNPLFGILSEEQRQDLFLEESTGDVGEAHSQFPAKGRARSNSVGDHHHGSNQKSASSPKRRNRASSFSHVEHFNERYNQVYVHHVRKELEDLRNDRSKSGATGCNCRKLTVYIPPKNGGGKKAAHRRLKPSKLRDELKKRDLYDESKSREDLEKILHDAVENEPCCGSADCFCFRNGIDCQADACSCWHDSHVHTKSDERYLSASVIKERCGNPLGTLTVDVDDIDNYRRRVLEATTCQFISTGQ